MSQDVPQVDPPKIPPIPVVDVNKQQPAPAAEQPASPTSNANAAEEAQLIGEAHQEPQDQGILSMQVSGYWINDQKRFSVAVTARAIDEAIAAARFDLGDNAGDLTAVVDVLALRDGCLVSLMEDRQDPILGPLGEEGFVAAALGIVGSQNITFEEALHATLSFLYAQCDTVLSKEVLLSKLGEAIRAEV